MLNSTSNALVPGVAPTLSRTVSVLSLLIGVLLALLSFGVATLWFTIKEWL